VGGFNDFLRTQRETEGQARVTLVQFDSQDPFEMLIDGADPDDRADRFRDRPPVRPRVAGFPLPNTDCRVVDEDTETEEMPVGERGVLCVSGPQVMQGYWNMPDATADGLCTDETGKVWLHTGDIAVMDESGRFAIVDRKKDMILAAGGFNVYPREIQDVLFEHPAVVDAGVIGVPVGGQDQRAKAFIVLEDGAAVDEEEFIEFCRERLARYKIPRTIEFRDELPKTFVGKVLRRELMAEEQAKEGSAG
jgi:long-chain acyl-CoA synthetase